MMPCHYARDRGTRWYDAIYFHFLQSANEISAAPHLGITQSESHIICHDQIGELIQSHPIYPAGVACISSLGRLAWRVRCGGEERSRIGVRRLGRLIDGFQKSVGASCEAPCYFPPQVRRHQNGKNHLTVPKGGGDRSVCCSCATTGLVRCLTFTLPHGLLTPPRHIY
jgi:hypothetical protein